MLKKTMWCLFIALAVSLATATAQDGLVAKQGRIDVIDLSKQLIVVDGDTYGLHDEVLDVFVDGQGSDVEALEAGMKVKISYQVSGDAGRPSLVTRVSAERPRQR